MRTERNKDSSWNVWLSRSEYEVLPREAKTFEQESEAIRLMGDCGLRVQEVLDVKPKHVSRMSDGTHFELKVVGGKDTTGEYTGGKYRETWLPRDVEATINRYIQQTGIDDEERLVPKAKRTVSTGLNKQPRKQPKKLETMTTAVFQPTIFAAVKITSLSNRTSARGSSWLSGMEFYDAIEPYLAAPTEQNIIESMRTALQ